ncbi:LuxR C-terminal-related transcriptional regulator [Actinosynnema sp. CA-299493]
MHDHRRSAARCRVSTPTGPDLSLWETEVLRLLVDGRTNAQIVAERCLSERTVHRHGSFRKPVDRRSAGRTSWPTCSSDQ